MNYLSVLVSDFYKQVHRNLYPKGMTKLVSYVTARMSRLEGQDKLISFGWQAFVKEYLIDQFNKNFFDLPLERVLTQYKRILDASIGEGTYDIKPIRDLHILGYLPIEIKAIAEGTRVPVKVPMVEISNTHPDFAWLTNFIESFLSSEMWHPMISANVGYNYRQIVNKFYDETVDDDVSHSTALGDFSFRGQESLQSAIKSSAAWALSFVNTATVPAFCFLEELYNADYKKEVIIKGSISTEHSVMCSNTAVDGNEKDFVKRLLTEIYPDKSFSMVSDSYDYWNMVENIIPSLKKEVLEHKGCLLIRGDSGDPVDIVTKTVFSLWKNFGGTVNTKGYKILDSHVKAIYGDSITPSRLVAIYTILKENGFACNNVALGVGSFSMQCLEGEDGKLYPYTRDTFSMCVKSTYIEVDGKKLFIFKNPKTDTGNFKKSQKGLCYVHYNDVHSEIVYDDEFDSDTIPKEGNLLEVIFKDGKMVKETSLSEIRARLHNGKF